jgi:hypothetical protein
MITAKRDGLIITKPAPKRSNQMKIVSLCTEENRKPGQKSKSNAEISITPKKHYQCKTAQQTHKFRDRRIHEIESTG